VKNRVWSERIEDKTVSSMGLLWRVYRSSARLLWSSMPLLSSSMGLLQVFWGFGRRWVSDAGLLRRCAPRNDGRGYGPMGEQGITVFYRLLVFR